MVERITSRRSTLRTLPALREEALPRPRAQRMCCGVHTESSADRSEMGKIDRSRRRRGCAGAPRHKICTASLDNRPLIDGFVSALFCHRQLPLLQIHWPLVTLLSPLVRRHLFSFGDGPHAVALPGRGPGRVAGSIEADGEGDVQEPCDTDSAPPRLTTGFP